MYCAKCGQQSAEGAQFCSSCGQPVSSGAGAGPSAPGGASRPGLSNLERPGIITLLAVLDFVAGACLLGCAAVIAVVLQGDKTIARPIPLAIAGVMVLIGALQIACGVGLLGLKPWGRTLQIVLACVGLLSLPIGTIISGLILYYMFKTGVKVLFSGKPAGALAPAEVRAVRELRETNVAVVIVVGAILLLVVVAVIGIIAAIAIPNLLNAIQRGKQKRTMADLRSIGIAIESYQVDNGFVPDVPAGPDAAVALAPFLEPTFISHLPRRDGWQRPFGWEQQQWIGEDGAVLSAYSIISYGKDGRADDLVAIGATTAFNADIYFSDGQLTRYPEGTQR